MSSRNARSNLEISRDRSGVGNAAPQPVGVTRDKDGKNSPSAAKSTRVYAKVDGKWMLVHANFAPAATKY